LVRRVYLISIYNKHKPCQQRGIVFNISYLVVNIEIIKVLSD
jgi:hypothetical protein